MVPPWQVLQGMTFVQSGPVQSSQPAHVCFEESTLTTSFMQGGLTMRTMTKMRRPAALCLTAQWKEQR